MFSPTSLLALGSTTTTIRARETTTARETTARETTTTTTSRETSTTASRETTASRSYLRQSQKIFSRRLFSGIREAAAPTTSTSFWQFNQAGNGEN